MATEGQELVYATAKGQEWVYAMAESQEWVYATAEGSWKWPKVYGSGRRLIKVAEGSGTKSAKGIW